MSEADRAGHRPAAGDVTSGARTTDAAASRTVASGNAAGGEAAKDVAAGGPAAGTTARKITSRFSRDNLAVVAALAGPLILTAALVPFRKSFANTDAALALILLVVAVAAAGNRIAGYLASASAAVWFDFFLTRPYERFSITRAADIETTVLLLVIGVAVTEIAVWGRRQHAAASRRAGYLDGINDAARAVAVGDSPSTLIDQVSGTLMQLLTLRSCRFQYGMAGIGRPARLEHDGKIFAEGRPWDVELGGLPGGAGTELLVESDGYQKLLPGRA